MKFFTFSPKKRKPQQPMLPAGESDKKPTPISQRQPEPQRQDQKEPHIPTMAELKAQMEGKAPAKQPTKQAPQKPTQQIRQPEPHTIRSQDPERTPEDCARGLIVGARLKLGLSQKNYGLLFGVSGVAVGNWEKGKSWPSKIAAQVSEKVLRHSFPEGFANRINHLAKIGSAAGAMYFLLREIYKDQECI